MKVRVNTLWLAGDPGDAGRPPASEANNVRVAPDFDMQWIEAVRGATASPVDRLNDKVILDFDVSRLFDTATAAQTFFMLHYQDVRAQSGKTVAVVLENGREVYLTGALIKAQAVGAIGRSLQIHYTIFAGTISGTLVGGKK